MYSYANMNIRGYIEIYIYTRICVGIHIYMYKHTEIYIDI